MRSDEVPYHDRPMDRPDPLAFDAHTALVVVDMQNDFADPAGSLYVTGGEHVIGRVNELIAQAEEGAHRNPCKRP